LDGVRRRSKEAFIFQGHGGHDPDRGGKVVEDPGGQDGRRQKSVAELFQRIGQQICSMRTKGGEEREHSRRKPRMEGERNGP